MTQVQWTTVIEERTPEGWQFFSQQSIKPLEVGRSDEEYLAECRYRFPERTLRIANKAFRAER